jgi:hypothetical protein
MKKFSLISFCIAGFLSIIFAFTTVQTNGIQGKILPLRGAGTVIAVLGTDTLSTPVNNGSYRFSAIKPGTYSVSIKGYLPNRDSTIVNVAVIKDAITDVGTILLKQN